MKRLQHRDSAASGWFGRALRHSALLAVPLTAAILVSCTSTMGLLHTAKSPTKQPAYALKTPTLDASISSLCDLDSTIHATCPGVAWQDHGLDLRAIKEKNAHNALFLAALEDYHVILDGLPEGYPSYSSTIDKKKNAVSLADAVRNPSRMLRISPAGSSGVRFDIVHYFPPDSASFILSKKTGTAELSGLQAALCDFCKDIVHLWTLDSLVSK